MPNIGGFIPAVGDIDRDTHRQHPRRQERFPTGSVWAQPAGNLLNVLGNAIDKVQTAVASAIADMKAFRFSDDGRSMSAELQALQGLPFAPMGSAMTRFEMAALIEVGG